MRKKPQDTSDFAWHVHGELSGWTARVDTKASIALAIEAASLGFVLTLISKDGLLASVSGWQAWSLGTGVGLIILSVLFSILVVIPQLRGRKAKREYRNNVIYFGHLRHWDPKALTKRLARESGDPESLSRQLVNMSKIVWRKHVWLQWSLAAYVAAVVLIGLAFIPPIQVSTPNQSPRSSTIGAVHGTQR